MTPHTSTRSRRNAAFNAATSLEYSAALKGVGLRVTAPRLATLDVVHHNQHSDANTIATLVRQRLGSVSTQAVYDVLHALTEAGLLRRISFHDRHALYETHRHDNHHHLLCRSCGKLQDAQCGTGEAPCLHPTDSTLAGFLVDEADVIYRGYCPDCQTGRQPN